MQQKSYTQIRQEFQEKFFKEIQPMVSSFEHERISNLCIAIFLTVLFSFLCVAIFIYFALKIEIEFIKNCLGFVGFFFGYLAVMTIPYIKKTFENSIKENIMPIMCSCFGNLIWTKKYYYGNENLFYSSNLMRSALAHYDDIFTGSYNDVKYEIIETSFVTGKQTIEAPFWKGVIIKLEMNKNFSGNTVLESHKKIQRGGFMSLISYNYDKFNNGCNKYTTLEDVNFNKQYDVYTDDEVEARYLLTTSFMEKLKNMKTAFKAVNVRCAFYNQYLLIGLEAKKDLFSICSLFKRIDDAKQFFTMFEEIISIIKLIDHLKLNQKIGL